MGYSVAVECRSKKLRDEMISLLDKEWKDWGELNGYEGSGIRPPRTNDLSYHHGKLPYIGCDYNAQGGERMYLFAFIRWLAIKIGKTMPLPSDDFIIVPFYIYDGDEKTPVALNCEIKGCASVDCWGVPIETKNSRKIKGVWEVVRNLEIYDEPNALDVIRAEIQRLDVLWNKQCTL